MACHRRAKAAPAFAGCIPPAHLAGVRTTASPSCPRPMSTALPRAARNWLSGGASAAMRFPLPTATTRRDARALAGHFGHSQQLGIHSVASQRTDMRIAPICLAAGIGHPKSLERAYMFTLNRALRRHLHPAGSLRRFRIGLRSLSLCLTSFVESRSLTATIVSQNNHDEHKNHCAPDENEYEPGAALPLFRSDGCPA